MVVFIYRETAYVTREEWEHREPVRPYPEEKASIIVAKHRNGPTGTLDLRFRTKIARFEDPLLREQEVEAQ